jgi:hypothetical protein
MKRTIDQHIKNNINELDNTDINSQRRRHLEQELESLENYKKNNPTHTDDPTALELFCDENPHAPECRIYEF